MANRFSRLTESDEATGETTYIIVDAIDGGHAYTMHSEAESHAIVIMLNHAYVEGWRAGMETAREIVTSSAPRRVADFDLNAAISFLASLPNAKR